MPWDESYSVVLPPKTLLVDPRIMLYTLDTIYPIKYIHFAGRRFQFTVLHYYICTQYHCTTSSVYVGG